MASDLACPCGCDGTVAIRLEDDKITYATGDHGLYEKDIKIPVYYCEQCGEGWTDWRAEEIRQDAWSKIQANIVADDIDALVLEKLKEQISG